MEVDFQRAVDELGRIVLPIEVRRKLNIEAGDILRVDLKDGRITLIPKEK